MKDRGAGANSKQIVPVLVAALVAFTMGVVVVAVGKGRPEVSSNAVVGSNSGPAQPAPSAAPAGTLHAPPNRHVLGLRDVTESSGLSAVNMYGRGVSLIDLDGDGWDDIFFADTDTRFRGSSSGGSRAFRNVRGWFEPWDLGIDRSDTVMNGNASFADFDDDGDPDVILLTGNNTGSGKIAVYENRLDSDGHFANVTADSGMSGATEPWWGISWGDLDLDGDLDAVVTGERLDVYINDGSGHFENEADALGVEQIEGGDLHNPTLLDIDNDLDLDIFITANIASRLLRNDDGHGFTDVTRDAFGQPAIDGWLGDGFVSASSDFDQDGNEDIWLGRWWFQDVLFLGRGDGSFEAHTRDVGIKTLMFGLDRDISIAHSVEATRTPDEGSENTMGLLAGDIDANGYPDVVIGPGDPSRASPYIMFCAFPDDATRVRFERCSEPMRSTMGDSRGHGAAVGDLDHDGVDDLLISRGGFPPWDQRYGIDTRERPFLWRGDPAASATTAHVRLRLASGAAALGARIRTNGPEPHYVTVQTTQGFQSQSSERVQVVVGDGASAVITWPDGSTSHQPLRPGDDLTLTQQDP